MMDAKKLAQLCALKCLEKKAENVVILDLENRSSVADFFVLCSGFSDRQVAAIADNVADELKKAGVNSLSKEGMVDGKWALIDLGSVIVHVFQDHLRDYYSLESLWADAPRIRVQEKESSSSSLRYNPDFSSGSPAF
jgi:ribosome-associated protein